MKKSNIVSTGILLTIFSDNFREPIRLNNFGEGEVSLVTSRGKFFVRGRFELIDNQEKGIKELVVYQSNKNIDVGDDEEIFYSAVIDFETSSGGVNVHTREKTKPRNYFINEVLIELVPTNDTEDIWLSLSFISKPETLNDEVLFCKIPGESIKT